MAKISPLAAKTLHNILANHAEVLEKKAPEANPLYVPLPKQTEDEIDDLTFTYADFSDGESSWGSSTWGSPSTIFTMGTSAEDLWGGHGDISDTDCMSPAGTDTTDATSPRESITDFWFGSDATDTTPTKPSSSSSSPTSSSGDNASASASADRDGSNWPWESRKERFAKMEAYKSHRVQRWTPRQLELFRYKGVFCGRDDDRDHDRLLAARYMGARALDFAERRRSQAKARFDAHSARVARTLKEKDNDGNNNESPAVVIDLTTEPKQGRKRCWVSMTVDEI
ncbi:hypothetical protein PG985_014747 [Apiospora marii]|uniref:uncharacterized protein n=1 Tax=Apiospora marii TaxID=335849 RepID=UPI00312EB9D2